MRRSPYSLTVSRQVAAISALSIAFLVFSSLAWARAVVFSKAYNAPGSVQRVAISGQPVVLSCNLTQQVWLIY
jgi:hypothetical protein